MNHCILFVGLLLLLLFACSKSTATADDNDLGTSSPCTDVIKPDGVYLSPDGSAKLSISGNARILKLSGSAYQRGYAYGYLLASEIIRMLNFYVYWHAADKGYAWEILTNQQSYVNWEAVYLDELTGMLSGIEAALGVEKRMVHISNLAARPVKLEDLKIANTFADWGCTSFTAWGTLTSDGNAEMFRNLDYYVDPSNIIKQSHLILAVAPSSGKRWMNATFCGLIGVISGMNEDGFSAVMQNTVCFSSTDLSGIIPRGIALRKLLENMSGASLPAVAEAMLEGFPAYVGNNFHLSFGSSNHGDDQVAFSIEYDGRTTHPDGRATLRLPSDNFSLPSDVSYDQTLPYSNALIVVNHYLKRVSNVEPYPGSCDRYQEVKDGISNALLDDGHVSLEEGRMIMEGVGGFGTIHTTVFKPDLKWMRIYLADGSSGAFECSAREYQFDELFE